VVPAAAAGMSQLSTLIVMANMAYIGLLPRLFFRRDGRLGAMWWLTAAPFLASGTSLVAATLGFAIPALGRDHPSAFWRDAGSIVLALLSMLLISAAWRAHPVAISLWHQQDDRPAGIVTDGPYRHVRHPFYAAFLLALCAVLVHSPHALTLAALTSAYLLLNATAAREERRLCASQFAADYQAYMRSTGRFFPRWSRHDA
jgi:protein-S-isoprenylcysteine O-methyltransferase Ste14